MKISFNRLNGGKNKEKQAILAAMAEVAASGSFILGPSVEKFEKAFARYIGAKYAIGVANGLEALQISLMALGIGPGDEVITTSLSAAATALSIRAVGAIPVFADIDRYCHIDPKDIEKKMNRKTKAIIPVHLYGQPADMRNIMMIARKRRIHVLEDCAQAHGALYGKKKVGSLGISGCFSFYPTKNLGGMGDGGMITTDDAAFAKKCRMIRNYGQKNRYEHAVYGINSRLDGLQAAILSIKLRSLDAANSRRRHIAKIYRKGLASLENVNVIPERKGVRHVYHLFVIEADHRDELKAFLDKKGIGTLIHYPIPIHKQKSFKKYNRIALPNTEKTVKRILSLPMHPYMKDSEARAVCKALKEFYYLLG